MKLLFVCLGNICRSPMAEGIMKNLCLQKGLNWQVDSAGTESFHVGEAPHPHSQRVCRENGLDISGQRAMQFKKEFLDTYDRIYALAGDVYTALQRQSGDRFSTQKVQLFLDDLYPGENRSVKDPWYGELEGYYPVYEEIYQGCEAILKQLTME